MSFLYKSVICAILVLIGSFVSLFLYKVLLISNPNFGRYVEALGIGLILFVAEVARFNYFLHDWRR